MQSLGSVCLLPIKKKSGISVWKNRQLENENEQKTVLKRAPEKYVFRNWRSKRGKAHQRKWVP